MCYAMLCRIVSGEVRNTVSMSEKIKTIIVTVLATLGVLFIIIMLMPDDEEDDAVPDDVHQTVSVQEVALAENASESVDGQETSDHQEEENVIENAAEPAEAQDTSDHQTPSGSQNTSSGNTVTVNIPENELSDKTVTFKTSTLDDEEVSQDIFSGYDITLVHVWGTYCQPCIAEIGDYGALYNELPDNVNIIGIVVDVYDGIDTNVSQAYEILDGKGVGFTNLRVSDEVYNIISGLQFVPSSFFVDREGHMVGSVMDGAAFKETLNRLNGYLDQ